MHQVRPMCRVRGVFPGGFYARRKRPPSARARADSELSARIAESHRRAQAGVRPSMGSVGDGFDNAMCAGFFATRACELLNRSRFKTQVEARMAVFDCIEGWRHPQRRHSARAYLSPINYERSHSAQADYRSPTPSTEPG